MKIKHPQAKGKRFEYKWRDLLRSSGLDKYAQRTPMSGAVAMMPSDIITSLPFGFECKRYREIGIYSWWNQAKRGGSARKVPVLVMQRDPVRTTFGSPMEEPILVAMDSQDWIQLVAYALKGGYKENI